MKEITSKEFRTDHGSRRWIVTYNSETRETHVICKNAKNEIISHEKVTRYEGDTQCPIIGLGVAMLKCVVPRITSEGVPNSWGAFKDWMHDIKKVQ